MSTQYMPICGLGQMDNRQKVVPIAHPENSAGELSKKQQDANWNRVPQTAKKNKQKNNNKKTTNKKNNKKNNNIKTVKPTYQSYISFT